MNLLWRARRRSLGIPEQTESQWHYNTWHVVIHRHSPRRYVTVVRTHQSNKVDFKKGISSRNLSYKEDDNTCSIPSKDVGIRVALRKGLHD